MHNMNIAAVTLITYPLQGSDSTSNDHDSTALAIADTQTAMLAKQIRDRVWHKVSPVVS